MKKILIILGSIIALSILTLGVAPFFFKDKIKAKVDEAISQNIIAVVYYDIDKFNLSFSRIFQV